MSNVKAILLTNTTATGSVSEFRESQGEMNEPMVLFIDKVTKENKGLFEIVAEDIEELKVMFEKKIFYTCSIPAGEIKRQHGALFLGVKQDLYTEEEHTAI